MKKNGYLRRFLALFLALVMIMADSSVTTFAATVGRVRKQKAVQKFEPGESVSYTEILGNAVYFGIVANTVNKQAHMDSNFATKVLNGASGNVTTGAYTENGAVYLVASVPNGGVLEMDGKSNILWCPEENRNNFKVKGTIETYPKETLDAYVDSMINHVSQKSTTIGNRNGYIVDNLANSKTIDIENCEAGTYYFDMSNYAQYGIDDLKIKKKSNQVVVLNYPTSNKVTLKRFELVNDGVSVSSATSNQTVDKLCRSIIFNMPQATEIDFASATAGLFIAPKATVTGLGGTSSGWIVVNSFTNNGGEWHCVYGELPKPENVEKPAQESFSVSKTVDGSTPTVDQKFVFRLEQIGDVPNGTTPISAKTVENNGAKVDFGTIKYNKEGTYYYRITETGKAATTSGEYTLDSQSYVVKIVVTANVTSSGNITTTEYNKVTTYYKGDTVNACTEENKVTGTTGITFNNETIEQKGNLKIVKAAGAGTNLVGKTFYFKISDENGNVVKNSNNSDVWSITFSANVENAINIENLEPGKYRVSETDANGNGVTTGEAFPYVVTGGGLVTVEGNKTANVVVTNTKYEAAGSLVLTAEKKLEGKQLEEGKYSFVLKDSKGTELQTKQNGADGSVSFDAIEYTLADAGKDFTYTVAEVAGNEAGVTYDSSVYTVKVHVADKGTGTLEVTKKITRTAGEKTEEAEKIVFNNKYEAAGSLVLTAEKKLEGKQLEEGKYSFVLKDSKGTELQTKQNGADGSVSFDAIEYTLADAGKDFTYTVAEVAGNEAGVTYDSSVYTVKVHVADKGTGTLEVTKKITRTAGEKTEEAEKIVFNNKYEAAGSLVLTAEKKLEGKQLEEGKYSFVLKDSKGTELQTKQNGADGSVSFDAIEYTLADAGKDFTYTVAEVAGNEAGVTYDSSVYTVKVHVADKGTGTLEVTKKITRTAGEKTEEAEKIVFNNKYEANGSITLTATKNLNGREFRKGDKWTFTVTCDDANAPMPEHPVVTTTATSGFTTTLDFGKINYTIADAGKSYVYIITETGNVANVTNDPVAARTVTVSVRDKGDGTLNVTQEVTGAGLTFTNKYADGETTLGVTKVLSGREFKSGDEWTFKLTADKGTPMPAQTVVKTDATSGNSQSLSFGTIKYTLADVGNTYTYTIHETGSAEGVTNDPNATRIVTVTVNEGKDGKLDIVREEPKGEIVFTNTYDAKGSLTLEASKTLKNKALEADAFNFVLKDKNGETIQTVANDADGNVTFSPLNYTLKDVGAHVYTVSEVQRENTEVTYDTTEYTVEVTVADAGNGKLKVSKTIKKGDDTVDAIAFENIYKGVIDISGSKTWNDADNQDGIRPASITVKLFANGTEAASQVVTPDEAGNWNYVFKNLPQYDAKGKITYTVTESAVAGYETSVSGYNITNTHKPETLDITGTKTWNDSNNQDGKRPKSITVNLLANGIITDTKTVTADDNWTYSFTDLPKYANGQEITYTVSELTVPGYTTTIDDNYNITNSYTPGETSASVTKIWDDADNQDGIRPESITVALLANGTPTNKTVTLTAANNWTQTITGLPEKADGEYITYTWTEVNVPEGYSLTGTSKNETVTTLTNTHTPELTSITGTKTWKDADNQDGKRPESITVNLFADGTKLKSQSVSADADGNWSYSFTDLPKYANGQEITYTVTEDAVDGYTTESDGYNFINTHQPETTEITGTKTWNDANNQDGKRPESITVILLANGTEKTRQAVTADEAGNWTYTFKDLPKYANGQEITYTVAEEEVTDYTTTYDGSNITNSYTPGKTSATVTKIWNDAENQDGKRPESITVSLLADGKETGKTVTLSVENNWKQTISDLPEKADGKAIEYTWTEETLPEGYELTDNSKNGTVTTLTNTYAPETTSITVTKTWDDADNQDGKRPESIIVNLLANGEIVASQTVKADEAGNWTYTFKDLPKYANGKEITYTVTEEAVEGYETSVDGFNITNTYTTETTEVKGSKTWNDADNQDGKRPESITVRLLANGEEKDSQTVTADENGNWTYSFEKLPKYEAGKEILYTVTEDAVADYTTEITGYDITNSYAPGKTSVTVTKAWADNDDRGGHRPKEIKVQLKADRENSGEEITLNAENNWTYTWSDLDQKKAGKDIAYTVEETGKAVGYISTVTGNAEEGFIITNTITSVKISKVDITDQKELAGAHIQVIDKDGNVVEEWDSTWEAHEVTGLKPGETYTLRETVAPEGYTLTSDTTFTLKEDGTVNKDTTTTTISDNGTLLVEDSRTSVKVSKVDISDGKELEGAHIQIIDQDGNVVDEWDSTKEAHVTEKLKTGKIYTLRETVAPDGYLLTSDTTFVLKEDGTVDAEKTTAVSKDGVLLVQDKLATAASIAVTKKLTYIGENLAARDQTFYVALYSDKDCTQRVSDVKALVFKNADASTVVFSENIKAGKTYYIAECTQDGTSQTIGALADGTVYEAVFGNGNSTTVTEANGTTTVSFENVFSSFPPDGFYKQGQLTITKKVLGADGGTRNSNEVFYAGIFDDAAHTQLSQQVEQNIIKLDMDGGYEVSEIINVGLAQSGAKVTLYVTETDSNGKPIAGSEGFGYKVTVSADSVIFDETNMTAEVVITNQEESTVTETPTPTPSSDGGNSGGSENHSGGYGGGKSPKTGDDTPIGTYLMLLLAAAMLAAETERRRRRNKRQ